jgi:TonB-dependent receptor
LRKQHFHKLFRTTNSNFTAMRYFYTLCCAVLFFVTSLSAQTGKIAGKILDAQTGETLLGAIVVLQGSVPQLAASSDLNGNYVIENVPVGNQKIYVTYVGYATKTVENLDVTKGQTAIVDIALGTSEAVIKVVEVTAQRQQEAVSTVLVLQRNNVTVSDGISGELIRRSPDRNVGEAIRRVSGVTIQDNRFPVVRGLNDRYNIALVNGVLLPSTEPDKRAFSFDIFPAALIDNILVNKAATPDIPSDFAGGVIQLVTKDIPEQKFFNVQIGSGFNTQASGKDFFNYAAKGGSDWLGLDDGTRALPATFPAASDYQKLTRAQQAEVSKTVPNDWALANQGVAAANMNLQMSGGTNFKVGTQGKLGIVGAITYSRNQRITLIKRGIYNFLEDPDSEYDDTQYSTNHLHGALLNVSYRFDPYNRISFKNNFNISSEEATVLREGSDFANSQRKRINVNRFKSNVFLTTQVAGEHLLGTTNLSPRFKWVVGYNGIDRNQPNQRQFVQSTFLGGDDTQLRALIANVASPFIGGKYYTKLNEKNYIINADLTLPYKWRALEQSFKFGAGLTARTRDFAARILGVAASGNVQKLSELPQATIYAPENFRSSGGFTYGDITSGSDAYTASSQNISLFAMFDNKITERLRVIWGARLESYPVKLTTENILGPIKVENTFTNILPSLNVIYALAEKSNLRFCASRTVNRPELRELAPLTYYDLLLDKTFSGNPDLKQADISNLDLRYEIFPEGGQLFSISAFYKKFDNPIEILATRGTATLEATPVNALSATNFGAELEFRKNLNFFGSSKFLERMTFFGNLAYIQSKVQFKAGAFNEDRALQGQSPYIINLGLSYTDADNGWGSTLLFNQVGRRIVEVGTIDFPPIYEAPRALLDFQFSKRIKRTELKLTISDIFNQPVNFYQDMDSDGKYTEGKQANGNRYDNLFNQYRYGTNVNFSLSHRF